MSAPVHLRVVSPLLAMDESSLRAFVTLPVGTLIETVKHLPEHGLVSIRAGDQNLLAFARDLEERTEPVDGT